MYYVPDPDSYRLQRLAEVLERDTKRAREIESALRGLLTRQENMAQAFDAEMGESDPCPTEGPWELFPEHPDFVAEFMHELVNLCAAFNVAIDGMPGGTSQIHFQDQEYAIQGWAADGDQATVTTGEGEMTLYIPD